MNIINLTPHEVVVIGTDGAERRYPPSGHVARVETYRREVGMIDGAPAHAVAYGSPFVGDLTFNDAFFQWDAIGQADRIIVSAMVLDAAERMDARHLRCLIAPDTGPESAVRDEAGRIVAVRGWIQR